MKANTHLALGALALLGTHAPVYAVSDPNANMIFVPVDQCRLVDTRKSSGGNLVANVPQAFWASGDAATISAQGGAAAGCADPKAPGGPRPGAAVLNVTAVGSQATANGNIKAYANGTAGTYSLVNYVAGTIVANAAIVPLCRNATCPNDGRELALSATTNIPAVVDVIGYLYPKDSNVVTVAQDGGDFLSPLDAMDYLRGLVASGDPNAPSAANPWVIQVSPGTYDLPSTLTLDVPDVTVRGAGKDTTILVGRSGVAQVKITRGGPALESLTVFSELDPAAPTTPTGDAIWIDVDLTLGVNERLGLKDVVARADEINPSAVAITSGEVQWSGGQVGGGSEAALTLGGASSLPGFVLVELDNVKVQASGPGAAALSVQGARLTLRNSTVSSSGGAALRTADITTAEARVNVVNSTLNGFASATAYAILDVSSPGFASILKVSQSVLSGPVQYTNASLSVATSQVDEAPTTVGTGTIVCVASYNSSFAPLDSTCN